MLQWRITAGVDKASWQERSVVAEWADQPMRSSAP